MFSYYIVPRGESEKDALVHRTLYAPNLKDRRGLEVILTDDKGKEVWRGPYAGPGT